MSEAGDESSQMKSQSVYIHVPDSRIIILRLGDDFRYLCLDAQPTGTEERRQWHIEAQHLLSVIRKVTPNPKNVVTVIIGPTEIRCDLDLLQRNSPYYDDGKPGMAYGLPSNEVSLLAFGIIYKWMSMPNEIIVPRNLMTVFKAASYLRIQVLVDQFVEVFSDPYTAREEIGFQIYLGLQLLNLKKPYQKVMRIHKYFLTLIGSPEFFNIWPNALTFLLASPNICVNSEVEVFIAIIRWVNHNYKSRYTYIDSLMKCVRFDCIPLEALLQIREQEDVRTELGQLLRHPEVEEFFKLAPSHNNNIRYCRRRIWVYDKLCEYHHDAHCPNRNFITFDQFQKFQEKLNAAPNLHWWHRKQLNPYAHNCRNENCRGNSRPKRHP